MFKKLLLVLTAATMIASPMATAQAQPAPHREIHPTVNRGHHSRVVHRDQHHRWAKGQHFDRRYAADYRVIDNYRGYRLKAPPRGYHWVRSGNDAVLVAITSGIIASVIVGAIR